MNTPEWARKEIEKAKSKSLRRLDLSYRRYEMESADKLYAIPDEVFELKQLEDLHLSGHNIEVVSNKIVQLQNLKSLNLARNELTVCNAEITSSRTFINLEFCRNS